MLQKVGYTLFAFLVMLNMTLFSQSGGNSAYDFLNLTNSARIAALGGQQISLFDDDLNVVFHNPSLLNGKMNKQLVLNYVNYFAGINYGYASYAWNTGKPYTLAAGVHYVNYGEFIEANESGIQQGTFTAADYAFNLYYSRNILDSLFRVGINIKPLYSDLETYTSFGLAIDGGITYFNPDKLFSAALVIKNAGMQIKKYYPSQNRESLPFEIQIGITKELTHAPFRFSVIGQQLQNWDLRYKTEKEIEEENNSISLGESSGSTPVGDFADNLMRHIIFGMEFIPSKNFNVQLGYNYKRRQELKIDERAAMVGFSWGFGVKINKFHINYGRSSYHLARGTNHFSITTNLSDFGPRL